MALLVDANNVLHAPMPPRLEGLDLAGLCRLVARTPWVRGGAAVVADAHPGPLGLLESPDPAVELIWSGHGRTADAVILDRIAEHPNPRGLIVVSSDHEIRDAARRRRATSWPSDDFLRRLDEALRSPPPPDEPEKPAGLLSPREVEAWLRRFGAR